MSLYGEYIKERKGYKIIENEFGFITFCEMKLDDRIVMYIEEIYVSPSYRESGMAKEFANKVYEIAKNNNILKILGSISPNTNGAHESMCILIHNGFRLHSSTDELVYFIKDL